jgi:hypothetical protein
MTWASPRWMTFSRIASCYRSFRPGCVERNSCLPSVASTGRWKWPPAGSSLPKAWTR